MRSIIIATIMCAATAAAQPWIDHAGKVAWKLPAQFHAPDKTVMINPTLDQLRPYGWAEAEQEEITEVITNSIDPELRLTIATYAALMQSIFGEGSHLNTNITEAVVIDTFATSTNIPLPVLTAFAVARDKLRIVYTGHYAHLPYGQTEIVTTNTITRWKAKE